MPLAAMRFAAEALDRVVEPEHYGTVRREGGDQQSKQDAAAGPRAPCGVVEGALIVHEPPLMRAAHDAHYVGHRTTPRVRIAPIRRICACRHERWTNSGVNDRMGPAKRAGKSGIGCLLLGTPPANS